MNSTHILVLLVCGDISVHRTWGEMKNKPYDLWIHYYGDNPDTYKEDCEYYEDGKGFKWPIIYDMVEKNKAALEQYDYIICPDDDIAWKNEWFVTACELMKKHNLAMGCPSVAKKGTCYKELHTKQDTGDGRFVDFVEMLTPIFGKNELLKIHWTLKESKSGWGIDCIWAWEFSELRMGCFDCISVEHMRPQFKGEIYPALAKAEIDPRMEAARIHRLYLHSKCKTLGLLSAGEPLRGV